MRITKQLVGAGVVAILAGCSSLPSLSSLNPFSGKSKGNQPAALTELKGSMAVRTAWKADIGKSSDYWFTPAVVGNTVVVASGEGTLARFESASGRQMWRIKIDNGLTAGVGTDGKIVVLGGVKGTVLAYDLDGKFLWKA